MYRQYSCNKCENWRNEQKVPEAESFDKSTVFIKILYLMIQWLLKEHSVNSMFWVSVVCHLYFKHFRKYKGVLTNFSIFELFSSSLSISFISFSPATCFLFYSLQQECMPLLFPKANSSIFAHNPFISNGILQIDRIA